jgi:hypothetical protein
MSEVVSGVCGAHSQLANRTLAESGIEELRVERNQIIQLTTTGCQGFLGFSVGSNRLGVHRMSSRVVEQPQGSRRYRAG